MKTVEGHAVCCSTFYVTFSAWVELKKGSMVASVLYMYYYAILDVDTLLAEECPVHPTTSVHYWLHNLQLVALWDIPLFCGTDI